MQRALWNRVFQIVCDGTDAFAADEANAFGPDRRSAGVPRGKSTAKDAGKTTKVSFGWPLLFLVFVSVAPAIPPAMAADEWTESPPPRTLLHRSGPRESAEASPQAAQRPKSGRVLPAQVGVFYPTAGQSQFGICWQGLRVDSKGNVYPIGSGRISKILPDGTLINGVDDQNFFASSGVDSSYFELDEGGGNLYLATSNDVLAAPFAEGSTFSFLASGLAGGVAVALGRGPLAGSLFATESANRVSRITLSPLGVSPFSDGSAFFSSPQTIASAPDGTLYVANIGFQPPRLTKITPDGEPGAFAVGTALQVNRAVAVDRAGNVYWSDAAGINKYGASGELLGTLPGPPDKTVYEIPTDLAFDRKGNLYLLENADCKKIYKYTRRRRG